MKPGSLLKQCAYVPTVNSFAGAKAGGQGPALDNPASTRIAQRAGGGRGAAETKQKEAEDTPASFPISKALEE